MVSPDRMGNEMNGEPFNEAEEIGAFDNSIVEGEDKIKYQPGEPCTPASMDQNVIISPDTRRNERIPPGQARTRKWPVLQWGSVAQVTTDQWDAGHCWPRRPAGPI